MHLRAFTSTNPEADAALEAMFPAPLSSFSWGRAVSKGEIFRVVDTDREMASMRDLARLRGYRSMLFVPLLRGQTPIGLIAVTHVEPGPFVEHHVQLLQTFAHQAVIAISNVQLFQQLQESTRELSTSLDDLRAAQDRLVQTEKLASLGQLTAGIAHEIKNPLNFVNKFFRALGGTGRRNERCACGDYSRQEKTGRARRTGANAEDQPRESCSTWQAR
jgi:signal transduction histidine kinase